MSRHTVEEAIGGAHHVASVTSNYHGGDAGSAAHWFCEHGHDVSLGPCVQCDNDIRARCHVAPTGLPSDAQKRKGIPIATGCIDYFPKALAAVAELSRIGNDKHNPGQPLHWSRDKSNDHADCLARHFVERGKMDTTGAEPVRHSTQMAWRALALLQLEIEAAEG